ncbi:MAG TPA: sulfurtransferase TusA family protein [Acetomicrobium flavidum]|uniref:sulfurtransferase TusA family protein n=1 Tax=Acetomicrobium flavidum TaxID=49896 RepID=UPI002BDDF8F6|nr:sulfurtransferase TusA family protein [Acetomicrobium flavidum]HPU69268.1 sulfurtransferase TusA family protein [Acetomicrobium flavidum]
MAETVEVDARGLSCPQPVIETKKAIEKTSSGEIHVLVDTMTSVMNVSRFAKNQGWKVSYEELPEGGFKIVLRK